MRIRIYKQSTPELTFTVGWHSNEDPGLRLDPVKAMTLERRWSYHNVMKVREWNKYVDSQRQYLKPDEWIEITSEYKKQIDSVKTH